MYYGIPAGCVLKQMHTAITTSVQCDILYVVPEFKESLYLSHVFAAQ